MPGQSTLDRRKKSIPQKSASGRVFTYFGECVCSDICGPFVESPQGFTYACNFYDKYSHHAAVYFMKTKEAEEIRRCHDTYLSDHKQWLKDGKITEWVVDDGLNFHSRPRRLWRGARRRALSLCGALAGCPCCLLGGQSTPPVSYTHLTLPTICSV